MTSISAYGRLQVASGVPELNGIAHAAEQCELAMALLSAGKMTNTILSVDDFVSVRIGINSGKMAAIYQEK